MRAFLTGATGFVGGRVAQRLRDRGDEVVCLVRSPRKAAGLRDLACEVVEGDLADAAAIRRGMAGCDAVFHVAADYRVGLKAATRPQMQDSNIGGTTRVLDLAAEEQVARTVYVSTIGAFGNTRGAVVDERYEHPADGFTSEYERTKWRAHRIAEERIAGGAPIVIVQPGGIYGPGDHSAIGRQLGQAARGKLPFLAFGDLGLNLVHVDDVVDGILLAHDKGRVGESYVLGGEMTTLRRAVEVAADAGGRRPPRITMPAIGVKAMLPVAPIVTKAMGLPPNLREVIASADGVTFWATDEKARTELGYAPRDLRTGLRGTFGAAAASS